MPEIMDVQGMETVQAAEIIAQLVMDRAGKVADLDGPINPGIEMPDRKPCVLIIQMTIFRIKEGLI